MKTLLIDGLGNITIEGLTIHFNQKFALNGGLATDEWYVSWDKIGEALCGNDYCDKTEVAKLRKLRKVNPVDAHVMRILADTEIINLIEAAEEARDALNDINLTDDLVEKLFNTINAVKNKMNSSVGLDELGKQHDLINGKLKAIDMPELD